MNLDDNLRGASARHESVRKKDVCKKLKIMAVVRNQTAELLVAEIVEQWLAINYNPEL